ncbi:MAG: PD-(D/E)XK nuclease family protein [Terracidiphilus sp.]
MGPSAAMEMDAWLRAGGLVVTASDRATRALAASFHRARRAEGLTAWPAPNIQDWNTFVRTAWEEGTRNKPDPRLLLNPTQEQALWAEIAGGQNHIATLLEGPRHRLAALAMEAHELICWYAPRCLRSADRTAWQQDAAAFSAWLVAFDEACRQGKLLSAARLPLELISLLEAESVPRPPLLLAGFDRLLPVQRAVFDGWGSWRQAGAGEPISKIQFHEAPDARAELAACVLWCGRKLAAAPDAHLLVVTQDASTRRGEIERAFLQIDPTQSRLFEFSLGVSLAQVALPKAAHLLLRWLTGAIAEHEVDWLLSTGYAASARESSALQAGMRTIRRRGHQQPQWTLRTFLGAVKQLDSDSESTTGAAQWASRIAETQRNLGEQTRRPQSPIAWAEMVPRVLDTVRFASFNPLSSAEYQALRRWQQTVESCGSLGFDGRRIGWTDFLSAMGRGLDATLFAPESRDAPIQVAGPAESAGLTADSIWFLGASEDAWPASGSTHSLLPPEIQRQFAMPHATPQLDWDLAHAVTTRLLVSAPDVHFSYARQSEAVEVRPSRLIVQIAGPPELLSADLTARPAPSPLAYAVEDFSRIPYTPGKVPGGASVLTFQSQCPFKAFATARLGAESWEPGAAGLTPSQRGSLLHEVLHSVWAGPPDGIRSLQDLQGLGDTKSFVFNHVRQVLQEEVRPALRERMPRGYLKLEEQRLTHLVTEWLEYESSRIAFEVAETEAERPVNLAGLAFRLRLDRVDRLNDGSLLVIDYKSGDVSPKSWELPRPDDVQLPLYAGFALDRENEALGGLVFAKVRTGNTEFTGRVADPTAALHSGLGKMTALVRNPLTVEDLIDWRKAIVQLAEDFLAGQADVDPREYPKTCERCGLQTICRIQENRAALEADDELDDAEASDE